MFLWKILAQHCYQEISDPRLPLPLSRTRTCGDSVLHMATLTFLNFRTELFSLFMHISLNACIKSCQINGFCSICYDHFPALSVWFTSIPPHWVHREVCKRQDRGCGKQEETKLCRPEQGLRKMWWAVKMGRIRQGSNTTSEPGRYI